MQKTRVAINGFGRIGRSVLRALYERSSLQSSIEVVAINEPADAATVAHLLKYDSTHGRFARDVRVEGDTLFVGEHAIALSAEPDLERICWPDVDVVLECSGQFSQSAKAAWHIKNGAKKVLFSQPADADVDATIVMGVNDSALEQSHKIVSAGSCTTNAIVPVLSVLQTHFGVAAGTITTLHSAMNDQPVIDAYHHTDLRKTRSAMHSMIPVDTALAKGVERILPQFEGKLIAQAVRVPTMNVSALDVTLRLKTKANIADIRGAILQAKAQMPGIIDLCDEPLASCDFNHDSHSAIIDAARMQMVDDGLLKLFIWFDNEWAYANRLLDIVHVWRA